MRFPPQRRAIFWSLIFPDGSAPDALVSLLFDPPEPQNIGKNRVFSTFLPFCPPGSSFFWLFLFSDLLSSSLLFSASFHPCFSIFHIVGGLSSKLPSTICIPIFAASLSIFGETHISKVFFWSEEVLDALKIPPRPKAFHQDIGGDAANSEYLISDRMGRGIENKCVSHWFLICPWPMITMYLMISNAIALIFWYFFILDFSFDFIRPRSLKSLPMLHADDLARSCPWKKRKQVFPKVSLIFTWKSVPGGSMTPSTGDFRFSGKSRFFELACYIKHPKKGSFWFLQKRGEGWTGWSPNIVGKKNPFGAPLRRPRSQVASCCTSGKARVFYGWVLLQFHKNKWGIVYIYMYIYICITV